MADDSGILHEIDEALRADNMEKMLRKYGRVVLVGCVGIILATAGSVMWKSHVRSKNMDRTSVLLDVHNLAAAGKYAEAGKKLEDVIKKSEQPPVIEELQYAGLLLEAGKTDEARKVYNDIQAHGGDDALRAFAALNAATAADNAKASDAATQKLDITSGQPFYATASELKALRLAKEGKTKEAHDILENLAADMSLSQSAHERAVELLGSIKGDKQ